jgi:hypothetical protein
MLLLSTWKSSAVTGLPSTCCFHSTLLTCRAMELLLLLLLFVLLLLQLMLLSL